MDLRNEILMAFDSLEWKRKEIEEKLNQLDRAVLAKPEGEGKWSVNQVLAHLSNSEFGTLRYIQKKMQGMSSLKNRGVFSKVRSKLLTWLLDSPLKYKMPKQLPMPSNELSYEELKIQFNKNRTALKEIIETFPDEGLDKLIFRHPFAGRFSLHQTVTFLEDHYNHHVRQIDRILNSIENK